MFLPIGYIMMAAGFQHESGENARVAANIGMVFAAVYAVLILLVYYAQTTTVRLEELNDQAARVLDYQRGGLLFWCVYFIPVGVLAWKHFSAGKDLSGKQDGANK